MTDRIFIVGIQRCGTTFLYHLLDSHPQIAMAKPVRPEPKVFLNNLVTGDPGGYDALLFPDDPEAKVRGEKSTSYIDHDAALRRIGATFPEARYLVALRDPVERALSHYRFSVDSGLEHRSVEEAIIGDLEGREPEYDRSISVSPFAYVRRGHYLEQLLRLERHTHQTHIKVVINEELGEDGAEVADAYRFLKVDPSVRPRTCAIPTNKSTSQTHLPPSLRRTLQDHYAPLNAELEGYLGRALDRWQ
jgi:hypothetical protein